MLTIGYLWETPLKAGERHIRRQVLGHTSMQAVILTPNAVDGIEAFPGTVIVAPRPRKNRLLRFYRKHVLRLPRAAYDGSAYALQSALSKARVDLVHVFFGHKGVNYVDVLSALDLPFTVSFHGADVGWCQTRPKLRARVPDLFDRAACVMVRSEYMRRGVEALGCPASKTWIHRTGIPMGEFPFLRRNREPSDPVTFLQVGRLITKKGLEYTIEAFDRVRQVWPGASLRIAGEGVLRKDLEAAVVRRGLTDSVSFAGFLDTSGLVTALHEADVYLQPSVVAPESDREGIPNSMLEAMATGLPPIATRHAGIPEAVTDGETGWLVDESSPEQLAERMLWCVRNPGAVADAGLAAHRHVAARYGQDVRMRALEAKFLEILADTRNTV